MSKRIDVAAISSVKALLREMKKNIGVFPGDVASEAADLARDLDNLSRAARGIRDLAVATVKTHYLDLDLRDCGPGADTKPADNVYDKPHYYGKGCGYLDGLDAHKAEMIENGNGDRERQGWDAV